MATGTLERTAAVLAAHRPLRILAIGSSSTQGIGASSPAQAYPARLEAALEARFSGVDVTVVNAGIGGETAERTVSRLGAEVVRAQPDLVLLQVGTNDALSPVVSEADFETTVERGAAAIEAAGIDVMLIDPQFFKTARDPARYERFVSVLARVAHEERICLFQRYRVMKAWDTEAGGIAPMLAADGFHMNDRGYACVADLMAGQIADIVAASEP